MGRTFSMTRSYLPAAAALGAFLASACLQAAQASVIWDETGNGDLSNLSGSPTNLGVLAAGTSTVKGSIGLFWATDPDDNLRFTVAEGFSLHAIVFTNYTSGIYYDYSPISLHAGATGSEPLLNFINLTDFGAGTNFLDFNQLHGYLPAGTYTLSLGSIQQAIAVDERSAYAINFNVAAVPEPSGTLQVLCGLAALGALSRARHRTDLRQST